MIPFQRLTNKNAKAFGALMRTQRSPSKGGEIGYLRKNTTALRFFPAHLAKDQAAQRVRMRAPPETGGARTLSGSRGDAVSQSPTRASKPAGAPNTPTQSAHLRPCAPRPWSPRAPRAARASAPPCTPRPQPSAPEPPRLHAPEHPTSAAGRRQSRPAVLWPSSLFYP